jgi:hypothetical protein
MTAPHMKGLKHSHQNHPEHQSGEGSVLDTTGVTVRSLVKRWW